VIEWSALVFSLSLGCSYVLGFSLLELLGFHDLVGTS
jgi:hypothetical protein